MKLEVENAVKNIKHACKQGLSILDKNLRPFRTSMPLPFPPLDTAADYFLEVDTAVTAFSRHAMNAFFESANALSGELQRVIPVYAHIAGDKEFKTALVNKHLLGFPSRAHLNTNAVKMQHVMAEIGRVYEGMSLTPGLEEDKEFCDDISQIRGVYDLARKAIATIVGANVLIEMSGAEKKDQAKFLLTAKKHDMPASLVAELAKI